MAVVRHPETLHNTVNYVATLAFFCCVSSVIIMLKFGGFKASLNFYNANRRKAKKGQEQLGSTMSITGVYRTNRDDAYYSESQRKSSPLKVPATSTNQQPTPLRQVKSTSELIKNKNLPPNLRQENPGVSQDPHGPTQNENHNHKNQERPREKKLDAQKRVEKKRQEEEKKLAKQRFEEQKKLEKQRLEKQKKREKLALQEQAKQEKARKYREKKEAQQAKQNKKKKNPAPPRPIANPLGQTNASTSNNPLAQRPTQYSTNTLNSSISKSSGPPPYSEVTKPKRETSSSSNVTYSKPIDTGSWDIISKHRENINRPTNAGPTKQTKQTTMDLNFKMVGENENRENSEA